jgi:thiamine biosynthesis lipoprotein
MASQTRVVVIDAPHASLGLAEERLRSLERSWSRFLPDSDISRLNAMPDTWVPVDPATITLIDKMKEAGELTDGRYDPTFLHELVTTGYDRSIDDATRVSVMIDLPCLNHRIADVCIDLAATSVSLPRGMAIDPGGIGKGLAGDLVVAELLRSGARGALVSIGGDIAAGGVGPTGDGWVVDVADPFSEAGPLATLAVSNGGVATSSTRTRRWVRDGVARHHVIDPTSGTMSLTDLAAVTVVAGAGWRAEAHATAALLCGSAGAIAYMNAHGVSGIATSLERETFATADLEAIASTAVETDVFA